MSNTERLRAAAQAALECLESLQGGCTDSGDGTVEAITVWCPEVIEPLRAALAEDERDWSLLEATQESLREHMAEIQRLRAALAQPAASVESVKYIAHLESLLAAYKDELQGMRQAIDFAWMAKELRGMVEEVSKAAQQEPKP